MAKDVNSRVGAVLKSGYIGQGLRVEEFEEKLGSYFGHPNPVTTNSATSGLTLALRLALKGSKAESEVLAPPITCTATNWPILAMGRRLRWVDTNPSDGNMDVADLRRKLSPNAAAIMLVHWGGYPNDLDSIRQVQQECVERYGHCPPVIEDAAHALGSEYRSRKLGVNGNFCVYSFQAIKHLTCGDGGALLCPRPEQVHRAKLLRWYGIDRESAEDFRCAQDIADWGYKWHMNDINAAIGLANFSLVEDTLKRHRDNAVYYRQQLAGVPGITLLQESPERRSAYWLFTLRAQKRDNLQRKLTERGIACGRVHERNDRYTCTRQFADPDLPGTDIMHREMLCIPVGWWVGPEQREFIVDVIREGW